MFSSSLVTPLQSNRITHCHVQVSRVARFCDPQHPLFNLTCNARSEIVKPNRLSLNVASLFDYTASQKDPVDRPRKAEDAYCTKKAGILGVGRRVFLIWHFTLLWSLMADGSKFWEVGLRLVKSGDKQNQVVAVLRVQGCFVVIVEGSSVRRRNIVAGHSERAKQRGSVTT